MTHNLILALGLTALGVITAVVTAAPITMAHQGYTIAPTDTAQTVTSSFWHVKRSLYPSEPVGSTVELIQARMNPISDLPGAVSKLGDEVNSSGAVNLALSFDRDGKSGKFVLPDLNLPAPVETSSPVLDRLDQASPSQVSAFGSTDGFSQRFEPLLHGKRPSSSLAGKEASSSNAQYVINRQPALAAHDPPTVHELSSASPSQAPRGNRERKSQASHLPTLYEPPAKIKMGRPLKYIEEGPDAEATKALRLWYRVRAQSTVTRRNISTHPRYSPNKKELFLKEQSQILRAARQNAKLHPVNEEKMEQQGQTRKAKAAQRENDELA